MLKGYFLQILGCLGLQVVHHVKTSLASYRWPIGPRISGRSEKPAECSPRKDLEVLKDPWMVQF